MTDDQREKVAHALGLPQHPWRRGARARRWAYRNHFVAGADDEPAWRDLEARGFAKAGPRREFICGAVFWVTPAGVDAAGLRRYVPAEVVQRVDG